MAGFVFGVAALARLTVIFAAPFFLFVGPRRLHGPARRVSRARCRDPVALLLAYNLLSSGHLFNPVYDYLYHSEYLGYMPPGFQINTDLGIEDVWHIPLNLVIMLGWLPDILPKGADCGLTVLNKDCPHPRCRTRSA